MANVGTGTAGNTLIGTGATSGPTFAPIGTLSGLTQHGVLIAEGTGAFVATTAGFNGQVLISGVGVDPKFATLTSVNGSISFTTGVNSLDLSVNHGGFGWTDVTSATQTLAIENGYVTDRGGGVTYTLPGSANLGDTIKIVGKLGIATITPNANQQLLFGSASGTVGATGTAVATNAGDCVELICVTAGASTVWRAANFVGNWTIN